jgi:DNA-directed RNA polymerase subunit M/transcription elongation factor TFIIS
MAEVRFIPLNCPNCGGAMQVGSDTTAARLDCQYCGKASRAIQRIIPPLS